MAEQMRPASNDLAPDPARSYGRDKPEAEAGMGRLDNNKATPTRSPDRIDQSAPNRQDPTRQINAHDVVNERAGNEPGGSMKDEEPMGWDQAPTDIQNPRDQRHPRTDGKGGTP